MLVSDAVLAEARIVNDKISLLYGLLRRIDGGVPQQTTLSSWPGAS
ncbi:hypothetical protein [Streptomyces sp. HUAS TT3]